VVLGKVEGNVIHLDKCETQWEKSVALEFKFRAKLLSLEEKQVWSLLTLFIISESSVRNKNYCLLSVRSFFPLMCMLVVEYMFVVLIGLLMLGFCAEQCESKLGGRGNGLWIRCFSNFIVLLVLIMRKVYVRACKREKRRLTIRIGNSIEQLLHLNWLRLPKKTTSSNLDDDRTRFSFSEWELHNLILLNHSHTVIIWPNKPKPKYSILASAH